MLTVADRTGLPGDVVLYAGCCLFASGLGAVSTLATHQAWARLAMVGYAAAALVASGQLLLVRCGRTWPPGVASRSLLAAGTAAATALAPLLLLVRGRVAGLGDRVQQEVRVVEQAGERWLDTGTPYLDRGAIAALPPGDQLGAYTPYQPAMAAFGLPRALDPAAEWWSDARLWFVAAAVAALVAAMVVLGRCDPGGTAAAARLRAWQAATVLPTATLAAAVGGDDLPVLALCLLALALTGRSRWGAAGLAVGAAGALKLIAWPVAVVLTVHAATRGRSALVRLGGRRAGCSGARAAAGGAGRSRGGGRKHRTLPARARPGGEPGRVAAARPPDRRRPAWRPSRRHWSAAGGRAGDRGLADPPPARHRRRGGHRLRLRVAGRDRVAAGDPVRVPALPAGAAGLGAGLAGRTTKIRADARPTPLSALPSSRGSTGPDHAE